MHMVNKNVKHTGLQAYNVRQKTTPKVFCHFSSNRLEFWCKVLHTYYLLIGLFI